MPKKSITKKFTEQHPKKDFYKALQNSFDGSWETLADNFQKKYKMKVGLATLKKYVNQGIKKGKIDINIPKSLKTRKRGKASIVDKFNDQHPNKDFEDAIKECFDGSIESLLKNMEKKYGIKTSAQTMKKYAEKIDGVNFKTRHKGKASLIDKFNKIHPDKDFYKEMNNLFKGYNHIDEHIHKTFKETYNMKIGFQTFKKYLLAGIQDNKINMTISNKKSSPKKNVEDRVAEFNANVKHIIGSQKTAPAVIVCKSCQEEIGTSILMNCISVANLFQCPFCLNSLINSNVNFTYKRKDYTTQFKNGKRVYTHKGKVVDNPAIKAIKANDLSLGLKK